MDAQNVQNVENPDLLRAAIDGLTTAPKGMSPKWLYDARGSAIFEEITKQPEYYPTRTETAILLDACPRLAGLVPEGAALVELGCGASVKTRLLLDRLAPSLSAYLPLDISEEFLRQTAQDLSSDYPELAITPVVADFMENFTLPQSASSGPVVLFFPGSTLGNLDRDSALALLLRLRRLAGVTSMIVGIDLVKPTKLLLTAYDDAAGVTATFNLNLLHRLNREANADFDVSAFDHQALWNAEFDRVEMHLVSRRRQTVRLHDRRIAFEIGESIHTENSHKFTREGFDAMVDTAGWRVANWVTDREQRFAVSVILPRFGGHP